jgi:hypothetical protein
MFSNTVEWELKKMLNWKIKINWWNFSPIFYLFSFLWASWNEVKHSLLLVAVEFSIDFLFNMKHHPMRTEITDYFMYIRGFYKQELESKALQQGSSGTISFHSARIRSTPRGWIDETSFTSMCSLNFHQHSRKTTIKIWKLATPFASWEI